MNYTDYKVMLDVHEIGSQVYLTAKQGDTNRRICASLVESGKPYQISEDCIAVFTAKKPDGHGIFNNCTIADNVITYEITEQTVAAVGEMACELRLYGADNTLLVCPRFTLNVVPAVFTDSEIVESVSEVTTLTSLIHEAVSLIADVNAKLENGDFIPKLSIGTVTTLPAGKAATAEFTGSGTAPVLNLGIPQGEQGQAESVIPDTELSESSTKPVQNRVIATALRECEEATEIALENKVDKEEGKGLSANDYTTTEKNKLAGIEAGANKYSLPVGGSSIGGVKNGGDIAIDSSGNMNIGDGKVDTGAIANAAVTRAKLAQDALYSPLVGVNPMTTISASSIGVTYITMNSEEDFVFHLNKDSSIPVGAEFAIMALYMKSCRIVFGTNVIGAIPGNSWITSPSFEIPEIGTMIAFKKLSDWDGLELWVVTGNVEVV